MFMPSQKPVALLVFVVAIGHAAGQGSDSTCSMKGASFCCKPLIENTANFTNSAADMVGCMEPSDPEMICAGWPVVNPVLSGNCLVSSGDCTCGPLTQSSENYNAWTSCPYLEFGTCSLIANGISMDADARTASKCAQDDWDASKKEVLMWAIPVGIIGACCCCGVGAGCVMMCSKSRKRNLNTDPLAAFVPKPNEGQTAIPQQQNMTQNHNQMTIAEQQNAQYIQDQQQNRKRGCFASMVHDPEQCFYRFVCLQYLFTNRSSNGRSTCEGETCTNLREGVCIGNTIREDCCGWTKTTASQAVTSAV